MKVIKFQIPHEALKAMPSDERAFFIHFANFLSEIRILMKCVVLTGKFEQSNEVEWRGDISQHLFFLRLLASKLHEGYMLVQKAYHGSGLAKSLEKRLPENARRARKDISKYFGKENCLSTVRDKFGFHYDADLIEGGFNRLGEKDAKELTMYLSTQGEGELCNFSDFMIYVAMHTHLKLDIKEDLYKTLFFEVDKVFKLFLEFGPNCLGETLKLLVPKMKLEALDIPDPPKYQDLKLPFFIAIK
jgi:hypothetical protein